MTHAERMAEIRRRCVPSPYRPPLVNGDITYLIARIERYEAALREIQTCGPKRFPSPDLAATEMLRLAREALADDEATD